jgi:Ni/Fe-hydrogenase subunit HybB-like protein
MADLAILKDPHVSPVLVEGDPTLHKVTDDVASIVENINRRVPVQWYMALAITGSLTLLLFAMLGYLTFTGIGVWGNNQPVGWAWDITNFVFWIGIGHAGTLISAILFLFRQKWRTSINRFAEAMTLFAVACALIYPLFHTGRPCGPLTGCSRCRTHISPCGRTSAAHWFGTVRSFDLRDCIGAVLVRRLDPRLQRHCVIAPRVWPR